LAHVLAEFVEKPVRVHFLLANPVRLGLPTYMYVPCGVSHRLLLCWQPARSSVETNKT